MQFDVWTKGLPSLGVDALMLGVFDDGELAEDTRAVDSASDGHLKAVVSHGDLSGKAGESLLLFNVPAIKAARVLLVGLGARSAYNRKAWRRALETGMSALTRTRIARAAVALPRPPAKELDDYEFGRAVAHIASNALYRTNDLKTSKKPKPHALETLVAGPVRAAGASAARRGLTHGAAVGVATRLQRDLGNLPANICTPAYLGEQAREIAKKYSSVKVQVLDEAAIRKEKMGCFLAVTQGSAQPPRFLILEHRGGKAGKAAPVVLVGKGITFDSGGISLKDPGGMDEMKYDMSGAAAVLSSITLAAELRLPLHIVGLVAACENMPSSRSVKPGDVITSASGQTVEILNTDAEGRLVLSDALNYARRFKPAVVVDIATLTGACVVALGAHHSGLISNDDALARELLACGMRADDRAWQLPLTEEYADQLKSNFADMANVAGREGGAITAGAFLSKFAKDMKWAHLDIAGTAWRGGKEKGSTGRPVPLLADFLIRRAGA
jgi:leucyl aminopeptidase